MHRHAWATFRSTFPEDCEFPHAPGYPIATYLESKLRESGIEVTAVDLWRDSGWEVDCKINGKRIYLFFLRLLDGSGNWVLCCTSNRGPLAWIRGEDHIEERWELARAVHAVMAQDGRFQDIRWYVERGWNGGGDDPFSDRPA